MRDGWLDLNGEAWRERRREIRFFDGRLCRELGDEKTLPRDDEYKK
jgi:hypothetical protein